MSNKTILHTVRPFLTNKGILMDNKTYLIHNGKTIHDEKRIAKTINHTYNNILEHTAGNKPTCILNDTKFDCIPQDLLIAKLNAYGLNMNTLVLLFSYLKNRKKSVRIKTNYSSFLELLSGVPHGSIPETLLFNIFLNDLFLFIKKASLHNYADDNTLSAFATNIDDLTNESQKIIG